MVWLSADYTASTASILNLFTLSLDRYWSITSPLKYLGKRTKSRALLMITVAWSISLLWVLPITGWSYAFNGGVRYVPPDKCNTEYDKNIAFKIATAICNFYLPLIAMIMINAKIYIVIRRRYHNPIMKYSSINSNSGANASNPNMPVVASADNTGVPSPSIGLANSLAVNQQNSNLANSSASQNSSADYNNHTTTEHTYAIYYQIKDNGLASNQGKKSQNCSAKLKRNRSLSLDISKLKTTTNTSLLLNINRKSRPVSSHSKCFPPLLVYFSSHSFRSSEESENAQQDACHRSAASRARSIRNITNDVRMSKLVGNEPKGKSNPRLPSLVCENACKQGTSPLLLSNRRKDSLECYQRGSMRKSSIQRSSEVAISSLKRSYLRSKRLYRSDAGHLAYGETGEASVAKSHRNDSTCSTASNAPNNKPNAIPTVSDVGTRKNLKRILELKQMNNSGSDTKINRKGFMNKQEKAFKVN
jgi:hypothetical protein